MQKVFLFLNSFISLYLFSVPVRAQETPIVRIFKDKALPIIFNVVREEYGVPGFRKTITDHNETVTVESEKIFKLPLDVVYLWAEFKMQLSANEELTVVVPFKSFYRNKGVPPPTDGEINLLTLVITRDKKVIKKFRFRSNKVLISAQVSSPNLNETIDTTIHRGFEHDILKEEFGRAFFEENRLTEHDFWLHSNVNKNDFFKTIKIPTMLSIFDRVLLIKSYVLQHLAESTDLQDLFVVKKINDEKFRREVAEVAHWFIHFELEKSPVYEAALSVQKEASQK
jgi:hypothetical protein